VSASRSLRGRLTLWLLAGMGLLLAAGGLLLNHVISSRLRRDFDAALAAEAKSLMNSTEQEEGRVTLELAKGVMPEFERAREPHYFQLWLADGSVVARSASLGRGSLARESLSSENAPPIGRPRFTDVTLPDGRPGRQIAIRYLPQVEASDETFSLAPPGSPASTLVLAHGREDLDAFLALMHWTLALVVLGLLAATLLLVKAVVGVGLAPLDDLAHQLETIDAASLGSSVAIEDAPTELVPTISHLNGLLARLKLSFERERTFSANLAHELRTPLAELRVATEVALKWPDDRAFSLASLNEVRGIGLQMEKVVINLLALARCDSQEHTVRLSEVCLGEVAASCWSTVAAEAEKNGIALVLGIPEDLAIVTDREKLEIILGNLFSNAVSHGTPGRPVTCEAAVSGGELALRVANATDQLTPADLPRLFDRFWRKDAARSGGQHIGLGLSLVSALCELLGFTREAQLRGDVFEVTLHGKIVPH
jgi:two-component system, OmpR family, heavy metal sensor histidine kinase CusS